MVTILADGENSHRLEDADGRHVGSVRNRTIQLRGLGSEEDAMFAAVAVWDSFDSALARQFPGWPRHHPVLDQLRLVHDGAYQWISDGRKPLARLLRTPADREGDQAFAIEFVLPSYASEGVAISAAQVMANVFDDFVRRRHDPASRTDGAVASASA